MTYTIRVMPNKVVRLYGKKAIRDPFFLIAESLDSLDFVSLIQRNFGEASWKSEIIFILSALLIEALSILGKTLTP